MGRSYRDNSEKRKKPLTYKEGLKRLTPREIEVLDLVERGFTNTEISEQMGLSVHTVRAHKRNICKKLAITERNGLQKWLWRVKK